MHSVLYQSQFKTANACKICVFEHSCRQVHPWVAHMTPHGFQPGISTKAAILDAVISTNHRQRLRDVTGNSWHISHDDTVHTPSIALSMAVSGASWCGTYAIGPDRLATSGYRAARNTHGLQVLPSG